MCLSTHSLLDLHPIPVLLVGSAHTLQVRATLIGLLQQHNRFETQILLVKLYNETFCLCVTLELSD